MEEKKDLNEKNILGLTPEQEEKLHQLRHGRKVDEYHHRPSTHVPISWIDQAVFVCIEGVSFSGHIRKIHNTFMDNGKIFSTRYDVETPHGLLQIDSNQVKFRSVKDYSHIIPNPKLLAMNTKGLLRELQFTRTPVYEFNNDEVKYSADEIKAVLSTREHIPSKKEAKIARKFLKK